MISRPLLWLIAVSLIAIFAISWWAGDYPAQLTIINSSGEPLAKVSIDSGRRHVDVATVANGEFRRFSLKPGDYVVVRCGEKSWRSQAPLAPFQAVVVYVLPGGRFEERSRLGAIAK